MKKVIERIVESPGAPNENDLWLNGTTLKKFQNGEWVAISGSGSEGGEGGGCDCEPVEANPTIEDSDVTTPLEALKVGNNIYSIPLPPMVVEGTFDDENGFVPNDGQPTYAEAKAHFLAGGLVYFRFDHFIFGTTTLLIAISDDKSLSDVSHVYKWRDPDNGGEPTPYN